MTWILWVTLVSCSHRKDFAEPLKAVCFAGLWMPGSWRCDGKSEAKFEENAVRRSKDCTLGDTSKRFLYLREAERMLKCAANSNNQWGSGCKTAKKFQSSAPVSGLPGVALYLSLSFSCLLGVVTMCHEVLDGERCQSLVWNLCFLDLEMFDDVWSEPRVAHGRFGWRSGMKTARQIHANFRSSEGNSSPHIQRFECTHFCRNLCCCGFLNFSFGSEERSSLEECFGLGSTRLVPCLFSICSGLKSGIKALHLNVWTLQILLDPYRIW